MAPTKREIVETYGETREDGTTVLICPHCEDVSFESLEQWKDHLTRAHGGYDTDEVSEALKSAPNASQGHSTNGPDGSTGSVFSESAGPGPAQAKAKAPAPRKLSARARELNEKANRCLSLLLSHLTTGISPTERLELEANRRSLLEAFIGIEFDFDTRLITLEGKMAIIIMLVAMYVIPMLPSVGGKLTQALKDSMNKAQANRPIQVPTPIRQQQQQPVGEHI